MVSRTEWVTQLVVIASFIAPAVGLAQHSGSGWSSEKLAGARDYWRTMHESAVVVLHDGVEIVNWGPTDRKIKLSSVRKSLLSILYGPYVSDGTLVLDKTLKELGINDAPDTLSEQEQTATLRMLMQARSGIFHDYVGGTPAMKERQPPRGSHPPGSHWYYNNWDFNALGTIFEQETQTSIGVAFHERVATPIGLRDFKPTDVYYLKSDQSVHRQYHFRMTARDLARVGQLMIQRGRWGDSAVLSPEWVDAMTTPYSTSHHGTGYGFMWWTAKEGVLFEGVWLPDGSYAAFGAMGKFLVVIPEYELVIAHVQMVAWPDHASTLPPSELPNRETDENNRKIVGHLIARILEAR